MISNTVSFPAKVTWITGTEHGDVVGDTVLQEAFGKTRCSKPVKFLVPS